MSTEIVTGVDVFAGVDPDRPVASIQRVGAGRYQVRLFGEGGEVLDRECHDDLDTARKFAHGIAALVDKDPKNPAYVIAVKSQLAKRDAQIQVLEDRVAELEQHRQG